jgi:general secretion pathway protein J
MTTRADRRAKEGGFTLIESLVALALMGLVLSALANLTAQWLPNWNRGLDRIQRSEMIGITLQRIADDLAAAQYVPAAGGNDNQPLFAGSEQSVTFVRTAIGPNAGIGLDVVHLSETTDKGGLATVRTRMPFHPLPPDSASGQLHFGEPVLLLRAPYRLSFAYAGEDQPWQSSWRDSDRLPAKIRLTVRDATNARAISTVASIHVQSLAQGDCKQGDGKCDGNTGAPSASQGGAQQGNSSAASPQSAAVGQGGSP